MILEKEVDGMERGNCVTSIGWHERTVHAAPVHFPTVLQIGNHVN